MAGGGNLPPPGGPPRGGFVLLLCVAMRARGARRGCRFAASPALMDYWKWTSVEGVSLDGHRRKRMPLGGHRREGVSPEGHRRERMSPRGGFVLSSCAAVRVTVWPRRDSRPTSTALTCLRGPLRPDSCGPRVGDRPAHLPDLAERAGGRSSATAESFRVVAADSRWPR